MRQQAEGRVASVEIEGGFTLRAREGSIVLAWPRKRYVTPMIKPGTWMERGDPMILLAEPREGVTPAATRWA